MESEMLPIEMVMKLRDLYLDDYFRNICKDWRKLPPMLGLISIEKEGYWSCEKENETYLKIVDKEKLLWARLKYGF